MNIAAKNWTEAMMRASPAYRTMGFRQELSGVKSHPFGIPSEAVTATYVGTEAYSLFARGAPVHGKPKTLGVPAHA